MVRLSDHFGCTYLINLPERIDRLRSAQRELAGAGMGLGQGEIEVFPAFRYGDPAGFPSIGSRGCFESHLECLRRAHSANHRSVLLIEDDIALSPSLPRLTPVVMSQLTAVGWDFAYFGHYGTGNIPSAGRHVHEQAINLTKFVGDVVSTHFYAINGGILERLIAHLENLARGRMGDPEAGPMPIDGAYNIFRRKNSDIRCFLVCPKLGWQSSSASDITPSRFDRMSFLRPVNIVLRDLRQQIRRWRT